MEPQRRIYKEEKKGVKNGEKNEKKEVDMSYRLCQLTQVATVPSSEALSSQASR